MHDMPAQYALALSRLLEGIEHQLDRRSITEAKPHFKEIDEIVDFCQAMRHLHFKTHELDDPIQELDERLQPYLLVSDGRLFILENQDAIFDCAHAQYITRDQLPEQYQIYCFTPLNTVETEPKNLIRLLIKRFAKYYWQCWFISFFINLLALSTPLFVIAIYNQVIGTHSPGLLVAYGVGILLTMAAFATLYMIRSQLLIEISAQVDGYLGQHTLEHVLRLPARLVENSSKASQINRLRDFNMIREFLTSQPLLLCFDLPFTFIFAVAIALLGGWLVVFPIIAMALFGTMFAYEWQHPSLTLSDPNESNERQQRQIALLTDLPHMKRSDLSDRFLEQYQHLTAKLTIKSMDDNQITSRKDVISDAMILCTALLLICFGAIQAIDGQLSAGGLIAMVILNWRALGPFKGMYAYLSTFKSIQASFAELKRLFEIPRESKDDEITPSLPLKGSIHCQHISFRYPGSEYPALADVDCRIQAGEIIAITGESGGGKSTLLKCIAHMYTPSFGEISIDRSHISQYPVRWLRQQIAYTPQSFQLIDGTLAQNLRLSNLDASEEALWHACHLAGIGHTIKQLPDGLDTQLQDQSITQHSGTLLQALSLARAWLKNSRLILLDDPTCHLDNTCMTRLVQHLQALRGKATIIVVTHHPAIMKIADRVLLMEQGKITRQGQADDILPHLLRSTT